MLNNLRIGTKLAAAFLLLILLSIGLGGVAMHEANAMRDNWLGFERQTLAKRKASTLGTAFRASRTSSCVAATTPSGSMPTWQRSIRWSRSSGKSVA